VITNPTAEIHIPKETEKNKKNSIIKKVARNIKNKVW
jgi:hypothetical protein